MKVIKNKIIPVGYASYLNFCGIIFTKSKNLQLSKRTENHEMIHSKQMKHLLYVFFYVFYVFEWFLKIIPSYFYDRGKFGILQYAYRSISFEQEAYYNQNDLNYLKKSNYFKWIKYIFKMYKLR